IPSRKQPKTTTKKAPPCPHSMSMLRSTRLLSAEKKQCPICYEQYFTKLPDGNEVIPVRMACQHTFCRSCIETHRSQDIKCPFPWCSAEFPIQPDSCELCAYWVRSNCDDLVLTVRAHEMTKSIENALDEFCEGQKHFRLAKTHKRKLLTHVRRTLTRFEWQYHSGADLAEVLDPFLLAINPTDILNFYGKKLRAPAPDPSVFPPRNDPDDYPQGDEPWIAGFFRQWALEYEKENGEDKYGWGVWSSKRKEEEEMWSWDWPFKRIVAHRVDANGELVYLAKWVGNGKRWPDQWINRSDFGDGTTALYDQAHGLSHASAKPKARKAPTKSKARKRQKR
ncbi:hypothetical protein K491DRAFT_591446, partial [Lophiostoma macrostomum CBS 122681]